MAQNIGPLQGAYYSAVPAVDLPKQGGGTARFTDVTPTTATAADVGSGKIFFTSDGTQTTGTASGGGGNDFVVTLSYNSVSQMWEPDQTYADTEAAYLDGKNVIFTTDDLAAFASGMYLDTEIAVTIVVEFSDYDGSPLYNWGCKYHGYTWDSGDYYEGGTYTAYETSDATADPSDVASGKVFFNANGIQEGTGSGGGSVQTDTKTATASNYPTSLAFTSMKGEPKMFTVRLNASVSSSGSTTYYYIVDITSHGTTTHGNCFRIGSTRQVSSITSGYSWSYTGTTLTITSSATSRSASPGAFYSGSYELMYVY